jgi:ribonucleoside-diphosphate reductase alpha chain
MMAAVQPFLSGAISKTVSLPKEVTVEEIEQVYIDAWKDGLKAVALYRDGCKRQQPLSGGASKENLEAKTQIVMPQRKKLPKERDSITHKFQVGSYEGYLIVGKYEDGTPGETFIKLAKEGSTLSGFADALATITSISLQYGVPLEVLVNKMAHTRFEPSGFTGNKVIPVASSITDYIFRWMGHKFLPEYTNGDNTIVLSPVADEEKKETKDESDKPEKKRTLGGKPGNMCINCGNQMTSDDAHGCKEVCTHCGAVSTLGCGG